MASPKKVTAAQARKMASNPTIRAALLAQLRESGELPPENPPQTFEQLKDTLQPPTPPETSAQAGDAEEATDEVTDGDDESDEIDPELLAATEAERDSGGAADPGMAAAPKVGDVPPATPDPDKPEGSADRNDGKDQTPAVSKYHVCSDSGDDKERYKLLYGQISLSNEDKKLARRTAHEFIEHEFGKGGRSELAAALEKKEATMSQTAYGFALRAAQNSYVIVRDSEGNIVVDEVTEKTKYVPGEGFLAWFDKLVDYAEDICRKEYREKLKGIEGASADLKPAKEVFGSQWTVLKSNMRRSIKAGFNPWDFETAGAYISASKTPRKASGASGKTNVAAANGKAAVNADNPTLPPALDDHVAAMHPALGASLILLIKAAKKVPELHATEAAQKIHNLAKELEAFAVVTAPVKQGTVAEHVAEVRKDAEDKGAREAA